MDRLRIPALLSDVALDDWVTVAYLGSFEDERYGAFEITPATIASWIRNFEAGVVTGQPRIPVDYSHATDEKQATGPDKAAAGWIVGRPSRAASWSCRGRSRRCCSST